MEKDKRIDLGDVREHLASMTFDSKMMWAYRQSLSIMNPFSHEIDYITPDVRKSFHLNYKHDLILFVNFKNNRMMKKESSLIYF